MKKIHVNVETIGHIDHGKTTLTAAILAVQEHKGLARRRAGGSLLDRVVTAGVTAMVTEESAGDWQGRHQRRDLGSNVCLFCRPFANLPTSEEYSQLLGQLRKLKEERSLDLVIFDPLADFLPGRENDPTGLLQVLDPLRRLAETGISFLLAHHTRSAARQNHDCMLKHPRENDQFVREAPCPPMLLEMNGLCTRK